MLHASTTICIALSSLNYLLRAFKIVCPKHKKCEKLKLIYSIVILNSMLKMAILEERHFDFVCAKGIGVGTGTMLLSVLNTIYQNLFGKK